MGVGNWLKSIGNAFSSIPVVGSVISGVSNIAGGAIQSNENKKMMREQMAWQNNQRELAQNFQHSERLGQNAYQTSERVAQNQYAEDMYNKYESPEAMVRQLKDAGLNPRLAAEGAGGSVAASSGSSGGAPSSGAPSAGSVSPPYQNINAWTAGFQQMADAVKAIGEAKKLGVDVQYLERTLNDRVKKTQYETILSELGIDAAKLQNRNTAKAYEKLVTEIEKDKADISFVRQQINYMKHLGALTKQQADTFMEKFTNEQNHSIAQTDLLKSQKVNTDADTHLKEAQTILSELSQSNVIADTALKGSLKRVQDDLASMSELEYDIRNSNSQAEKDALRDEFLDRSASAYDHYLELLEDGNLKRNPKVRRAFNAIRTLRKNVLGK